MGKIIKWSLIILVLIGVFGAIFGDDEEAAKTDSNKAEVKKEAVKPETKKPETKKLTTAAMYLDCKPEILSLVKYPDSVDVKVSTAASRDLNDGQEVRFKFTTKNEFGMELPYTAVCEFNKNGELMKANVFE